MADQLEALAKKLIEAIRPEIERAHQSALTEIDSLKVERDYFSTELQALRRTESSSLTALQWLHEHFVTLEEKWRALGSSTDRLDTLQFAAGHIKDAIDLVKRGAEAGVSFYGSQCRSYPNCRGGCGLGCTKAHEPEPRTAAGSLD
jgi:hypothetical protein